MRLDMADKAFLVEAGPGQLILETARQTRQESTRHDRIVFDMVGQT